MRRAREGTEGNEKREGEGEGGGDEGVGKLRVGVLLYALWKRGSRRAVVLSSWKCMHDARPGGADEGGSENVSPFSGSRLPSRVETTISSFSRRRSHMARGEKPWRRWCARRLRRDRTLARSRPLVTRIERRTSRVASLTRPREPHLRAAPARRTSRLSSEHEISWRRRRFRAVFANRTLRTS